MTRLYPGDIGIEPRLDPPDEPDPLECAWCEDDFRPELDESFWYCSTCAPVMRLDFYKLRHEVLELRAQTLEHERFLG